ncbi:hypothetical protein [Rhodopila sp.]|uniref:hypothetical protein n=1 Tax=Rhodopila sp. TaxID=2480087 RepID=UPI003D0972E5
MNTTTQTTPATDDRPFSPADMLMALLINLLAPMFLTDGTSDLRLARMAAMETVNGYRARSGADLLMIVQIVAFGLAALGSLSLSMADDLPLLLILRLRGNAAALNRAAEQNRRALEKSLHAETPSAPDPAEFDDVDDAMVADVVRQAQTRVADAQARLAEQAAAPVTANPVSIDPVAVAAAAAASSAMAASSAVVAEPAGPVPSAVPVPPAGVAGPAHPAAPAAATQPRPTAEQQHRAVWAAAMSQVAGECTASLASLSPAQRRDASIWATALSASATDLLAGAAMPPATTPLPNAGKTPDAV